jgi:hypothetical protein
MGFAGACQRGFGMKKLKSWSQNTINEYSKCSNPADNCKWTFFASKGSVACWHLLFFHPVHPVHPVQFHFLDCIYQICARNSGARHIGSPGLMSPAANSS